MIGGTDIILPVHDEVDAANVAIRQIGRLWPDIVLEDGETGEIFPAYWGINLYGRREILAFRDAESARLWDEIGPDPSLDGTLVHFLLAPGELTLSVDDIPPPQIAAFVRSLRTALRKDLFASKAAA